MVRASESRTKKFLCDSSAKRGVSRTVFEMRYVALNVNAFQGMHACACGVGYRRLPPRP